MNNNTITRHLYRNYIKQDYLKNYETPIVRKKDNEKDFSKNKDNILLISNLYIYNNNNNLFIT